MWSQDQEPSIPSPQHGTALRTLPTRANAPTLPPPRLTPHIPSLCFLGLPVGSQGRPRASRGGG